MIDRRLHPEGVWQHLGTAGREATNSEGGDNSDAGTNTGTVADALGNTDSNANTDTEGDANTDTTANPAFHTNTCPLSVLSDHSRPATGGNH